MKKRTKKILFKIGFLTLIFAILAVSMLAPFMLVEKANTTLGVIIVSIIAFVYLLSLFKIIWDSIR